MSWTQNPLVRINHLEFNPLGFSPRPCCGRSRFHLPAHASSDSFISSLHCTDLFVKLDMSTTSFMLKGAWNHANFQTGGWSGHQIEGLFVIMQLCVMKGNPIWYCSWCHFCCAGVFWWLLSDRRALQGWQASLKNYHQWRIELSFDFPLMLFCSGSKGSDSWKASPKLMWGKRCTAIRPVWLQPSFPVMKTY